MSKQIGTIHDFYEWVKARDPAETYNYYDADDCANARYCRERGVPYHVFAPGTTFPSSLELAAQQNNLHERKRYGLTMGDLRREIEEYFLG